MDIDSDKLKEYIRFQINRKITNLYKQFLFILEDLRDEKYSVEDPKAYSQTRKRILDLGNDAIREIEEHFKHLQVDIRLDNETGERYQIGDSGTFIFANAAKNNGGKVQSRSKD